MMRPQAVHQRDGSYLVVAGGSRVRVSEDEVATVRRLMTDEGMTQIEAAEALDTYPQRIVLICGAFDIKRSGVSKGKAEAVDGERKKRTCLKCRQVFWSEHRFNRVCAGCKKSSEWRGGDNHVY